MRRTLLAATALALAASSAQAITIEFDYTYDTGNFFTGAHRSVLDAVATEFGGRLTDSLAAITVGGVNRFQPEVGLITGESSTLAPSQSIPEDTLRIFVGARPLAGNTLGAGGNGYSAAGTNSFLTSIQNRGQALPQGVDYGPFGGAMVFDSGAAWYLDDDITTVEAFSSFDFYSVVIHELGHVLGVGTSAPWTNQRNGLSFTGDAAMASYGGPVPLDDAGHLLKSIDSTFMGSLQEPALTPSITAGQRKYFTDLDWALLSDVGWQVAAIPEPETWAMMLAGLGLLGWRLRRRA
ncbi:PEPxxWA-CTERM sorting domain-containing protein [Denitromonas iodatirespirans]|uniref:PEPxxWA-CTERM sorting domain-containing protein n=1 Tax=Denitromonas iodatirespirans TaxID=2795389 RepID=A0A944DQJ1_DENI1|nr:PEPxxWA-CTERM sorting domain-containing protein [Denitromonas iodatirespirans]MBT0962779.1 PEPxxWA-CTERM sorting domain-containing protein [Denitromonas iodatirespirans]